MRLSDITVDTNVFLHAENPIEKRFVMAQAFLDFLRNSTTLLCVDEGFDVLESKNRSQIGAEYLDKLKVGSVGNALVSQLALYGRVVIVTRTVPQQTRRLLDRLITDKSDRIFARVAFNSQDKTLVSHDFAAFPAHVRKECGRSCMIKILDADGAAKG